MPEEKLTQAELQHMFGDTIPIEAVNLIWNSPDYVTVGEIRKQLSIIGKGHKRYTAVVNALSEEFGEQFAGEGYDGGALCAKIAKVALVAADAIAAPGGVPFDDAARTALAEIANIAFNMKQGESQPDIATMEFKRISERADVLLRLVDKARAGS